MSYISEYAMNIIIQFIHDTHNPHMVVVERILRLLKFTPEKRTLFLNHENLKVEGYINVDCVNSKDDRRSTIRYFTFVGKSCNSTN